MLGGPLKDGSSLYKDLQRTYLKTNIKSRPKSENTESNTRDESQSNQLSQHDYQESVFDRKRHQVENHGVDSEHQYINNVQNNNDYY